MRYLLKIFYFACALLASLGMVLSLIIVTPLYALIFATGGRHSGRLAHGLSRFWATYVLVVTGTRLKVHGKDKLISGQAYVFISNHRSQLDIPISARATAHFFKFLAKDELGKVPLLGYIIRKLYITVKRKSMRDRVESMKKMQQALQEGTSIWLYPEGTRNKSTEPLAPFQDGAFHLAVSTGMPIAVLTIIDSGKNLPSGEMFQLKPGLVHAYWDTPVPSHGLNKEDVPMLREKVKQLMLSHFPDPGHNL